MQNRFKENKDKNQHQTIILVLRIVHTLIIVVSVAAAVFLIVTGNIVALVLIGLSVAIRERKEKIK